MAFDEDFANRIREVVQDESGLTEKRMFGGLAFLINGNMAVSASGQGGMLLRVDPADTATVEFGRLSRTTRWSGRRRGASAFSMRRTCEGSRGAMAVSQEDQNFLNAYLPALRRPRSVPTHR